MYAGTGNNGKIYRSSDGTTWAEVEDTTETRIYSLASFNGYLYAGTYPNGKIYRSSDGVTWAEVEGTIETYIFSLTSFDECLYAGTGNNGKIYRDWDSSNWYSNDWDHRLPVTIDNTGNVSLTNYLFDVSIPSGINESSICVVDGLNAVVVPHWSENVSGGVCYGLWFNASIESEINTDFYIYYDNNAVASASSYNDTFGEGIILDMPLTTRYADGNTIIDRSTHANNGTNYGTTIDSDYTYFDGTNDYINISLFSPDMVTTKAYTISYIINTTQSEPSWNSRHVHWYDGVDGYGVTPTNLGKIYIYTSGQNTLDDAVANGSSTNDGTPHLITTVFDQPNDIAKIYIDKSIDYSTTSYIDNSVTTNSIVWIGVNDVGAAFYSGRMSDIRFYDKALSASQITSLYEQHNTTPSLSLGSEQPEIDSQYKTVITVINAFPATLQHTLTILLSYIPLLVGGLIAGFLIILVMSVFGKLKRW